MHKFLKTECVDGTKLQDYSDSYCGSLMTTNWKISEEKYNNYQTYDAEALANYKTLYQKWKNYGEGTGDTTFDGPGNDCLGIGRALYCAYSFPYCEDGQDKPGVCDFLCDLWKYRCPDEDEEYDKLCANKRGKNCADGQILQMGQQFKIYLIILLAYLILPE
ncbi:hypothetical protein PPERSA_05040 [Pseudocohnilembus persalinus]|uniref:Uncharacterized protein n=1 Tax=Pseudocohnilembus persalinus TaxID=266149 RepID=A0A0V0QW19_PSEPJ|nr:hypothetical protein PPERSA_05040 [Pseudocohnilembus persalinus]|eukprot:KRX06427.1 hypothetical protein PPERSA_05040 [Pseudocohnilembus persalinus]